MIFLILLAAAHAAPQCIDTSDAFSLPAASYGYTPQLTPDGQFVLFDAYNESKLQVLDVKNKILRSIDKPTSAHIGLSGNQIFMTDFSGLTETSPESIKNHFKNVGIKILDSKSGKFETKKGVLPYKGELAEVLNASTERISIKTKQGITKDIPVAEALYPNNSGLDAPMTISINDSDISINYDNGETAKVNIPGFLGSNFSGSFTPDNKYYLLRSNSGNTQDPPPMYAVDLKTKQTKKIQMPKDTWAGGATKMNYDPKTETYLARSYNSNDILGINLGKGEVKPIAKFTPPGSTQTADLYFNKKGQICILNSPYIYSTGGGTVSYNGTFRYCGPAGSDIAANGIQISDLGNLYAMTEEIFSGSIYSNGVQTTSLVIASEFCPTNEVTVDCDCELEKPTDGTSNVEDLKSVVLATACSAPFDEKAWDKITADKAKLTEGEAVVWLKRLSKPGSFKTEQLDTIVGILNSNIPKSYPGLTKSALRSIMVAKPQSFHMLTKRFPKLIDMKAPADNSCLTTSEKSDLEKGTFTTLQSEFAKPNTPYAKLKSLAAFGKDSLNDTQKQSLAETAADRMVEVGGSGVTAGVFSSKIYYFAEYNFQKILGLPSKDITDFTVVRNSNQLRILQLGRDEFAGSTQSPSGVYIRELGSIPTESIKSDSRTDKYKWKYGHREFMGELTIDRIQFDETNMALNKSPDYKDMWKDKEFRGVVVAGTNLGQPTTQQVMNEYVEYYTQAGFTFEAPKDNDDMLAYMKEKVSGKGQMDYFVKEAHSGGDEKTMFGIAKKGKVLIGTKQVGDKKEVIELIYPDKSNVESVSLNNAEFGSWAKEREKNGGSELMYLNTSCWSATKAVYEIPAAATKKLINIPTTTAVTVMSNRNTNIMRNLLEGIRTEKDYEGIRQQLKKNPDYATGKSNMIIFPDEKEYRTRIVDQLQTPISLDSKVSVKNASGQYENYNIGTQ